MSQQPRPHSLHPLLTPLLLVLCLAVLLALSSQPWNRAVQSTPGMPGVKPTSGRYENRVTVTLRTSNPRSQIVYTLDGSEPTAEVGMLYAKPLVLDTKGVTIVRAVEVIAGEIGPVRTATYVIDVPGQLPLLSIALPPASLWDADAGILANQTWRGQDWEREGSLSYMLPDGEVAFSSTAGLRVDKEGTKPDLRLYFRSEYGSARLAYSLYPQHQEQSPEAQSFKRLLLLGGHPGADVLSNANGGLWQDLLASECASAVGLRSVQGQAVHLFINSKSWGIYYLAERVDRFFMDDNYGYDQADVVREGKVVEGDDADWDALIDWVSTHDLADSDHYAYVHSQIDMTQFIDAVILHLYLDFPPDSLIALRPQLGRWEWIYAGGGETGKQQMSAGGASDLTTLYSELLANEEFRLSFAIRAADLLNTVLSPTQMEARIATLDAAWKSDYDYERGRWFYGNTWEQEILDLRLRVDQRDDILYALVQAQTGLPEDVRFIFTMNPPDAGHLYTNGMLLDSETEARFFAGTVVTVTAQPERWPLPGYRFTGWEVCEGTVCSEIDSPADLTLLIEGSRHIIANFAACQPGDCPIAANDVIISEFWINDNGSPYGSLGGRPITGDWVELRVLKDEGDLRGWRLTDNDTLAGTTEGSLIFPDHPGLASLDEGTVILVITTLNTENADTFPEDDLNARDKRLLFYVGNGNLDVTTDPGFGIGQRDDNVVLLAPGPTESFMDDIGVDFIAEGNRVTPYSFGILGDGVQLPTPFRFLGGDDGASWLKSGDPDVATSWRVDPPACQSGDAVCWGERNQVTPGR